MTIDDVRAAALQLERVERAALVADLLDSIDRPETASQDEIDAAWRTELDRRSDDMQSGQVKPVSWDDIEAQLHADQAARR